MELVTPPISNDEAEKYVLGSVLLDNNAMNIVRGIVTPEDFYVPAHAVVFQAMLAIHHAENPIDIIFLTAELTAMERFRTIGGTPFLLELTDHVASTVYADKYATIVADCARCRRMANATQEATARLTRGEPIEGTVASLLTQTLAREERRTRLVPIGAMLDGIIDSWEHPVSYVSTGLRQVDDMMLGGLRAGDMIGVVGSAGGGKSALVGQIAVDVATHGATVIYASVEMPPAEVISRWIALLAFRLASPDGLEWAIKYADVYYGRAWRGENCYSPEHRERMRQRLLSATVGLDQTRGRLFVEQIEPGSTVDELATLVAAAREKGRGKGGNADMPVVLVVDPLQRLFASERGGRRGRAADAVNANETERVGAVAQELKFLCDTQGVAVIFTSDTTKAAAMSAMSSVGSMRGSYQLNHLATAVFGMHTAQNAEQMRQRLNGPRESEAIAPELTEQRIDELLPLNFFQRADAQRLGARVSVLECSKHRRGAAEAMVLGFVPGATCFVERTGE